MTVTLIAGAGYLGARLAHHFAANGDTVVAIRRGDGATSVGTAAANVKSGPIEWILADLAHPDAPLVEHLRGRRFDRMIICISPAARARGTEVLSSVDPDIAPSPRRSAPSLDLAALALADPFLSAIKGALRLAQDFEIPRVVYTSSTGVYAESNGGLVDETSDLEPVGFGSRSSNARALPRAARLVMAERIIRGALPRSAVIARLSGLYGPGRNPLPRYESEEAADPASEYWTNRVHLDDAISAIETLCRVDLPDGVANVSDDEPAKVSEIVRWIQEMRGQRTNAMAADPAVAGRSSTPRTRTSSNKRISNTRLRALGWTPRYPSFREGFAAFL
jgi:nucleoside-diphosphate-sugar epimerase